METQLAYASIMLQLATLLYLFSMAGYLFFLFDQKDRIQKISFYLVSAGVGVHFVSILLTGIAAKDLPVQNMVQSLSFAGFAFGGMFLYFQYKFNLKILGVFAATVLSILMLAVMLIPDTPMAANEILRGFWFVAHIVLVFTGDAALGLACGAGILYLLQEKGIRSKNPGFFFKRLPSLDFLDNVSYTCMTTGFVLLTFGLITGFIYAKAIWGRFWSWDFKEVFSIGTWLLYATLLHFRFHSGWRGRKSAIMTIVGFVIIIFTFLGVNIFLGGHHQNFTK
jgi:cytochrome c-type biogenesis protein CcsB